MARNGRTVLVVDDERYIVDLLTDLLDDEGYRVISAFDGLAALQKVKEEAPDLILADIMMPRLDGLALLTRIREEYSGVPVVLMSAAVTPLMHEVPYIAKPFDLDDLLDIVDAQFTS
ncbi:MAG TPA: response regulator [Thermomicrobiales bacterium]|nr:response regulator [Thermomicrobiales bacterium]